MPDDAGMRSLVFLLLFASSCAGADPAPAAAPQPAPATARPAPVNLAAAREEVKSAEVAFAAAFRDRDKDRFFSYLADDAVFLGAQKTLRGKQQVIETWSGFFADPAPPFSWRPERVEASADGSLGLSTGPVLDPAGKQIGTFSSIWRRQPDGSWKVAFDGPGCSAGG
jgi:ketosteroid isomerase-like protein